MKVFASKREYNVEKKDWQTIATFLKFVTPGRSFWQDRAGKRADAKPGTMALTRWIHGVKRIATPAL
jgi:hypothetical protein